MLIVSDVHARFDALGRLAGMGETLLVLGDLINLMDYRTGEGIVAEVLGIDFGREVARARGAGDYRVMARLWRERVGDRRREVGRAMDAAAAAEYRRVTAALRGGRGYVTFGNVDRPKLLAASLPEGMRFVDGETVEVEGLRVGFVGGGVATPLEAQGEVTDEEMRVKLNRIGAVDVLCSHLPPAVEPLRRDVITGRAERSSRPILEYLQDMRPAFHFFGDVHQPQASRWRVGPTQCRNVGYFRATQRALRLVAGENPVPVDVSRR